MKLRYYLRGIGLGILITSVFFMAGKTKSIPMTDEQVIERAKELGMIQNPVLTDLPQQETEEFLNETQPSKVVSPPVSVTPSPTSEASVTSKTVTPSPTPEASVTSKTVTPSPTPKASVTSKIVTPSPGGIGKSVTITINKGEGSDTVSKKLKEAGLIEDDKEYDRYLMQNGYDKKIAAGTHEIMPDSSWEEIARILCKR